MTDLEQSKYQVCRFWLIFVEQRCIVSLPELRMADKHIRQDARWMGQARQVDSHKQAILPQRSLANSGPSSIRCLQTEWVCGDVWGYRQKWVIILPDMALRPGMLS
jgi:hypothetical protein